MFFRRGLKFFIDGTYDIFRLKYTLVLIAIVDSNGNTEIVGVGILNSETDENFQWLIDTFKAINEEACAKLQCVMGDKDGVARKIVKNVLKVPTLKIP